MKNKRKMFLGFTLLFFAAAQEVKTEDFIYTFVTDTGYYFATSHEGKMGVRADFMEKSVIQNIPYSLGEWKGYELEHNDENIVFFRAYRHSKEDAKVYFIAVHGTVERTFHTAEVCYINDNWKVMKRGYAEAPSADRNFQARYFTACKDEWRHLLVYWFLWKDSKRLMNEGCVMFRVAVRMSDISEEKAMEYAFDFIKNLSGFSSGQTDEAVTIAPQIIQAEMPNTKSKYFPVREKLVKWLKNQMVPNSVVPSPAGDRRNLILSYELPETAGAYKYIYSKSSLYDNGVAVIAFCIERQFNEAARIIDAIIRMGGAGGELYFTFNTHNSWPNEDDNWGAIIRSGASAWAGQAIVFYLKARLAETPGIIEKDSEMQSYLGYAEKIADRMLARMITDEEDARYGLITGGRGTYRLALNKEINKVEEDFVDGEVDWCSMEHNIDMYFFLKDLGKISDNPEYGQAAELMARRLAVQCWNEREGQFNRGQSPHKEDDVMALDCASWGSLFLFSRGEDEKAKKALAATDNYAGRVGYRPYLEKPIYESYEVGKFYFPENPRKAWSDVDEMWTEGALGVALAHIRAGNKAEAKRIIRDVIEYQSSSGGIHYSSIYVPHEFSKEPSVASTGWLTIVIGALEEDKIADLFWR